MKSADTRFATKFLLISRAVDVYNNLERMVVDPEWSSRIKDQSYKVQQAGTKVKHEVQTASLWKHVKDLLKLLTQIYLIFRFSDQGGPAMAVLDGKMREERETMVNFETNNFVTDIRLRNCMKLYDVRLEWFRNPVHQVWYIVNPHYASKTNLSENNKQDLEALMITQSKFLPNINDQAKALSQYNFFRELGGAFGTLIAQAAVHTMPPHKLFATFGVATRPFSLIAMKVLNMCVDQSGAELSFKRQGNIHSKKRNRMTQDNIGLVWLSTNLAQFFIKILEWHLLTQADVFHGNRLFLVQDNYPKHRSKLAQKWVSKNMPKNVFQWLSQSPDLNPIENVRLVEKPDIKTTP